MSTPSVPTPGPKLAAKGITAGYGDVQVLWDITLDIAPGEIVAIVGSNGAGKSTFMRAASGLIPIRSGSLTIDGLDMSRAAPADLVRAGIAHVPEGRRLFSAMSVRDNLLMGAYLRDDKAEVAADLERMFAMFPILKERQSQDAGTLSGTAAALSSNPAVREAYMGLA